MDLAGKQALVTGGARRVGRVIALALAEQGADIILHYHSSAVEADQTADEIREVGVICRTRQADLADPQAIEEMFTRIERLDVLVNNASAFHSADFLDVSVEAWDYTMAVNLRAPFLCTQHAVRLMTERGGVIINLGDMLGRDPDTRFPDHSVSKAAVITLTQVAAKSLAPYGIRVNAVVPGLVMKSEYLTDDAWEAMGNVLPIGRPGQPEHIAQAIIAQITNDFVTGAAWNVDGGDSLLSFEDAAGTQ